MIASAACWCKPGRNNGSQETEQKERPKKHNVCPQIRYSNLKRSPLLEIEAIQVSIYLGLLRVDK